MRLRERPCLAVRALMPAPTHLPSLSDALRARASVFGPFDGDVAPAASRGPRARCGAALRSMADVIEHGVGR